MDYKVLIEKPVSRAIGRFGLSRAGVLRLLVRMQTDIPGKYESYRKIRMPDREDYCRASLVIVDQNARHVFSFVIDDSTAQGILFVKEISRVQFPMS